MTTNMIQHMPDDALQLWMDDPTEDHPIFQALMILLTAGGQNMHPARLAARLAREHTQRSVLEDS
jgi:hypothetical protein